MHRNSWGVWGRRLIEDPASEVLISPVVPWEIAIKANKHNQVPHALISDFHAVLNRLGFTAIGIDPLHAIRSGLLPFHHRDPFTVCWLRNRSKWIPVNLVNPAGRDPNEVAEKLDDSEISLFRG
jgi:PIN domain nuclease of toxin-antitoxin system